MRHFSIFEPNAYPPQNLIVGRIIERHPKKNQNDPFERFCSAGIVYRRVILFRDYVDYAPLLLILLAKRPFIPNILNLLRNLLFFNGLG